MQWVELMGPQGIGKTTLRRHLLSLCSTARDNRPAVRNKDLRPLIEGWDYNRPSTWSALSRWGEFLEVVEGLYRESSNDEHPDRKRRRNFCTAVLRMSVIQDSQCVGAEVWDLLGSEGMRLSYLLRHPKRIQRYFETMPLSLGVVLLEADASVVVQRNRARVPSAPNFERWAVSGAAACAVAAEVLTDRCAFMRLNATGSVVDNAQTIARFAGWREFCST